MSRTTAPEGFDAALELVEGVFEAHLARVREIAALVVAAAAEGPLTEQAIEPLRDRVVGWLATGDVAWGYGFVGAPGVVDGKTRYLFWFQRSERDVRRLQVNFDIEDVNAYDYLNMEWYDAAEQRRRAVVHGPWVDYTGSGQYVLTATIPVVHDGRFLGVAGSDLLVSGLENQVLPALKRVQAEALLVNANRQVVVSNSPQWIPGDRLRTHPLDGDTFRTAVPVAPDTGWALAVPR